MLLCEDGGPPREGVASAAAGRLSWIRNADTTQRGRAAQAAP